MEQLTDIFKKNQYDLKQAALKSKTWFQQQTLLLNRQKITPAKIIKSDASKLKSTVIPGSLYMFLYDAKHKETLE